MFDIELQVYLTSNRKDSKEKQFHCIKIAREQRRVLNRLQWIAPAMRLTKSLSANLSSFRVNKFAACKYALVVL